MESFRKRYKTRDKVPAICCALIITAVLFLTTGFSSFSEQLSISAMATVRVQADIRVTNVSAINGTNGATSNYEEYNVHNITSAVNLPNANSTITYHIEVTNIGNVEQGIFAIDEIYKHISTNADSDLEIKSKTVNLKESLCDDTNSSQCKLGSVTTFDITIGYKNNGYDGNNLTHLVQLDFDFRRMFDITYVGFSGNTSGLPNKMIDGDTKTVTFDNTSGIPTAVTVTGATGSYSSPTLTLSNITIQNLVDTIVVTRAYSVTYTGFTGNTGGLPSTITATGGTITFNNTTGIPTNVVVTGASGSYSSPTLTLSSVTGNVTIANAYPITYTGFTNSTSGLPSAVPVTGGTITFDSTSGIPTSVTVTGATGSYSSPTLTLTNITGSITITADFSSGSPSGSGTEGDPYVVPISSYDSDEVQPGYNSFPNSPGAPAVVAQDDGNGNAVITSFEYTNSTEQNPVTITSGNSVETGVIALDGGAFTIHIKFKANIAETVDGVQINKNKFIVTAFECNNGSYNGFALSFMNTGYLRIAAYKNRTRSDSTGLLTPSGYSSVPSSALAAGIHEFDVTLTYDPTGYQSQYGQLKMESYIDGTKQSNKFLRNTSSSSMVPTTLTNAIITLGGNGIDNSDDVGNIDVIEFSVSR